MKWVLILAMLVLTVSFVSADISITKPIQWETFTRVTTSEIPVTFTVTNPVNCWYEVLGTKNYTGSVNPCNNGVNQFVLSIFDDGNYVLSIFYLDSQGRTFNAGTNFSVLPYVFQKIEYTEPVVEENQTGCCTNIKQFVLDHLYVNNNLSYATEEIKGLAVLLTQGCNMKIDSYTAERMVRGYNLLCTNITGEIPTFKMTDSTENPDENFINDGSFAIVVVITITIICVIYFVIRRYRK